MVAPGCTWALHMAMLAAYGSPGGCMHANAAPVCCTWVQIHLQAKNSKTQPTKKRYGEVRGRYESEMKRQDEGALCMCSHLNLQGTASDVPFNR
eukprot:1160915-Pelagomonas_calceolata.AAC.10